MDCGCHKAKGLKETDFKKGSIKMDKRAAGPIKNMGYPDDMRTVTPAAMNNSGRSVPSDLKPGDNSDYGKPKSRYM